MGSCKVFNVDVVAYARTVRCGVISAENIDMRPSPRRYFEDDWNQVCFRVMPFSTIPLASNTSSNPCSARDNGRAV